MTNLSLKQKIIAAVIAIGIILIAIFQMGFSKPSPPVNEVSKKNEPAQESSSPKLISTNPSPLDGTTLLPNQTIEMNFNMPLENVPEFKMTILPEVEVKVELSGDKKTAKITPVKAFQLGQGYTLSIKADTKFEGKKILEQDHSFGFKTIQYRGV